MLKPEIRIIAWDDCAFRFADKRVRLVGVIFRGGSFLDGMLSVTVDKDGIDATGKMAARIISSRHYDQLSYIMLDGISFGGFNIVDIQELNTKTKLPVLVVQRKKPDVKKFRAAMRIFPDYKARHAAAKKAGTMFRFGDIFYQKAGLRTGDCEQLFKLTCVRSNVPEPLRVAHLIASGLRGESRGRV